jgi:hypothetical protein
MPTAIALANLVWLADKLAHDLPRNLDVASLRYGLRLLADSNGSPATLGAFARISNI